MHGKIALLFDPTFTSERQLIRHLAGAGVRDIRHRSWKTKRPDRRVLRASAEWPLQGNAIEATVKRLPGVHAVRQNMVPMRDSPLRGLENSILREISAGTSTFLAMVYIVALVPVLLADVLGVGADVATSLAARTVLVCLGATLLLSSVGPFAAGPGIVPTLLLVAFVAEGIPWTHALGIAVNVGAIFTVLALFGVVSSFVRWTPPRIKTCIALGIGWYLIVIACITGGLGKPNSGAFLDLVISWESAIFLGGCAVVLLLYEFGPSNANATRGRIALSSVAILLGMVAATIAALLSGSVAPPTMTLSFPQIGALPGPDLPAALQWHYLDEHIVLLVVVAIDVVATFQVMVGLSNGELGDDNGNLRRMRQTFVYSGLLATAGPLCGLPPLLIFFESSTGVQAGGRTAVTALVVASFFAVLCFAASLATMVPQYASAIALAYVGYSIHKAEWRMGLTLDRVSRYLLFVIVIALVAFGSLALAIFIAFLTFPIATTRVNRKQKHLAPNARSDGAIDRLTPYHWLAGITSAVLLVIMGIG